MLPLGTHLDHGHHSEIFVVQDVTMIDGPPREILKRDPDSHAPAHGHIDDVSPSPEARALVIYAYDLERV